MSETRKTTKKEVVKKIGTLTWLVFALGSAIAFATLITRAVTLFANMFTIPTLGLITLGLFGLAILGVAVYYIADNWDR